MDVDTRELAEFQVGAVIGRRFEIVDHLGFGAMGLVLKVKDNALEGNVIALKILYPHLMQDQTTFQRFLNEVVIAQKLAHPNIVRTHDIGRDERGYYFISMELVKGRSLESLIYDKEHPLTFVEICRLLLEVTKGLGYAHEQGIVHRDLKPQNIIVSDEGKVKIADFGLAETLWMKHNLTRTGESVGTPSYMAPEQIQGEEADCRADIYSFGIMAYEAVVREKPFDDENWFKMASKHLLEPIPEFATEGSNIPLWYQEMVNRCCEKKREDRLQNIVDIGALLEPIVTGVSKQQDFNPVASVIHHTLEQEVPFSIPSGVVWAATSFLGLVAIAAFVFVFLPIEIRQALVPALTTAAQGTVDDFLVAAQKGDADAVKTLLAQGLDPNSADEFGNTALIIASREGWPKVVDGLLSLGAKVEKEVVAKDGMTALGWAIKKGNVELVRALVSNNASVRTKIEDDWEALNYAVKFGNAEIVKTVAVDPLQFAVQDPEGFPAFVRAAKEGSVAMLEALKEKGADVNVQDKDGWTALMWGVKGGDVGVVETLIKFRALSVQPEKTQTALGAIANGLPETSRSKILNLLSPGSSKSVSKDETKMSVWTPNASSDSVVPKVVGKAKLLPGRYEAYRSKNPNLRTFSLELANQSSVIANNPRISIHVNGSRGRRITLKGVNKILPGQKVIFTAEEQASKPYNHQASPLYDISCDNCDS